MGADDHAWRPCLKCGQPMWTTRGHRLCAKCARSNAHIGRPPVVAMTPALRDALAQLEAL